MSGCGEEGGVAHAGGDVGCARVGVGGARDGAGRSRGLGRRAGVDDEGVVAARDVKPAEAALVGGYPVLNV